VYSFWYCKKCMYVGKGKDWKRLQAYKKSIYLKYADRLKALLVKTKSRLPSAECLVNLIPCYASGLDSQTQEI